MLANVKMVMHVNCCCCRCLGCLVDTGAAHWVYGAGLSEGTRATRAGAASGKSVSAAPGKSGAYQAGA
jgi:hypothetical protein